MRFIISGGGTAGHINPAIAIADKIKETLPDAEILFVGGKNGMESRLVPLAGYPIWGTEVEGLKRKLTFSNIKVLLKTLRAVKASERMIEKFHPDAVIGTGGYVCFPVISAARRKGIYTALHESNAFPGLAVRRLKKRTDRIFVSFPECIAKLGNPPGCILSGTPLKSGFEQTDREKAREKLGLNGHYRYLVVSFGGSLGAATVNKCALDVMGKITSVRSDVLHLHSCGKNAAKEFYDEVRRRKFENCPNIRISEYIYEMPTVLKAADAVICRSGATTLAEIAAAGVPAVLIPSPNVTGNHQYKNAEAFSKAGAAFLIDERKEGDTEKVPGYLAKIITDNELWKKMSERSLSFASSGAADIIVSTVLKDLELRKSGEKGTIKQ